MAQEPDRDGAPPRANRRARRAVRWLAIALGALAVLAAIALIGINTPPGKDLIKRQVEGLEFENGLEIGIGRLEGSLYGNLVIRDLALRDPQGVFARADRVTLDWRPFAFIGNRLDIRSLSSPEVVIERLPEFAETAPDDAPLLPSFDIDMGRLVIDRIVVDEAVTGRRDRTRPRRSGGRRDRRACRPVAAACRAACGRGRLDELGRAIHGRPCR